MNDGLVDGFRHNTWSTRRVLLVCQGMTDDQLDATVLGTYGSIIASLRHIVASEAGYCARLTGEEIVWNRRDAEPPDLDELAARVDDLDLRWDRFLATPFDAERTFIVDWYDGGQRDVPAGVYLAQALHHGTDHRSQICTTLTSIGVDPPGLGLWEFAEATNRARPRAA